MSGDGFGDATQGDVEKIGRSTDGDSVIADAEHLCAGDADQVEGDPPLPGTVTQVAKPSAAPANGNTLPETGWVP